MPLPAILAALAAAAPETLAALGIAGAGTGILLSQQGQGGGGGQQPASQPTADTSKNQTPFVFSDGSGVGGDSIGGLGGYSDPQEAAYWSDQLTALDQLLGDLSTQRDQGLSTIDTAYNNQQARANQQQSEALSRYATQRGDTESDKLNAVGRIDASARNAYNSLQRLLGMSGAGMSSAAQQLVPTAVSQNAAKQRGGVVDAYGRNLRDIDTAETSTKTQFANLLEDLLSQRNQKRYDLESGVIAQQQGLRQQQADAALQRGIASGQNYTQARSARAPYQAGIDERRQALASLFNQYKTPTFDVKEVNAATPNLAAYTYDPTRVASAASSGVDTSLAPYLPAIQEKNKNNPLYFS